MDFKITKGNENAEYNLKETHCGDIIFLSFSASFPEPTIPSPVSISWYFGGADIFTTWNPDSLDIHGVGYEWGKTRIHSRLASWMPVQQLISKKGKNKLLVAISDVDTPTRIGTGLREEDGTFACEIEFFTSPIAPTLNYTSTIRLDLRAIPYYDAVYDCTSWWENDCGYKSAYVPECAREPMDSLWYSFHQDLSFEEILKECKASAEIGLKTVIIDDGWQTEDNSRGYAYCGDWQVATSKMKDMAELVEEIHKIGQKIILWYSVPFVGMYSEKYDEFKDYFLDGCGNAGTSYALDPRYKKVRDYLVKTYVDAVTQWNLDGLKLDFIDSFRLQGESLEYDERRDYSSLEEGIHALMSELKEKLTKINPDIMIEFRQSYVGPSIRKYGNMLRVGDCPCDIHKNRAGVMNLRLTSGKTPVHSDMIMWSYDDTVENAALQFASILYSVPQISVRVDKLSKSHLKMLKSYIDFWYDNKSVLLDGKLTALHPESNYSLVSSTLGDTQISTAYSYPLIEIKEKRTVAINATENEFLIIKNGNNKHYKVINCMGEEISSGKIESDLSEISTPTAGRIEID